MNLVENIIGFHHYSLKAENFPVTLKFYQSLGFKEVHSWSLPEFNLEKGMMLFNKKINCYIEIFDKNADIASQGRKRRLEEEFVENSILHICFIVKDALKAQEYAVQMGAKELSKGVDELVLKNKNKEVSVRNSLVYSPNGEVIEFLEKTEF